MVRSKLEYIVKKGFKFLSRQKRSLTYLALLGILNFSCGKNPIHSEHQSIMGSWVLISYQNLNTNFIRFSPKTYQRPTLINFDSDSTFTGQTSMNLIKGKYELGNQNKISITQFGGTKRGEPVWGDRIWKKFPQSEEYVLKNDTLMISLNSNTEFFKFIDVEGFDYEAYQQFDSSDNQNLIHEQFFRHFGNFKEGSWWLYKEVDIGKSDSMYISRYGKAWYYHDPDDSYNEYILYSIESTTNDKLNCNVYSVYQGTASDFYFYYPISVGLGVSYQNNAYRGSCPNFSFSVIGHGCSTVADVIGSMEIGDTQYQEVIKTSGSESDNPNPIVAAYFVMDIGLVRKDYENGEIYELSEYEIKD